MEHRAHLFEFERLRPNQLVFSEPVEVLLVKRHVQWNHVGDAAQLNGEGVFLFLFPWFVVGLLLSLHLVFDLGVHGVFGLSVTVDVFHLVAHKLTQRLSAVRSVLHQHRTLVDVRFLASVVN